MIELHTRTATHPRHLLVDDAGARALAQFACGPDETVAPNAKVSVGVNPKMTGLDIYMNDCPCVDGV